MWIKVHFHLLLLCGVGLSNKQLVVLILHSGAIKLLQSKRKQQDNVIKRAPGGQMYDAQQLST